SGKWPLLGVGQKLTIAPGARLHLAEGWWLACDAMSAQKLTAEPGELLAHFDLDALPANDALVLRTRKPGDYIQPLGMDGRKSLQDLNVDAKIPRALRDHIALLAIEGSSEVLWVPGLGGRRSARATIRPQTVRVLQLA